MSLSISCAFQFVEDAERTISQLRESAGGDVSIKITHASPSEQTRHLYPVAPRDGSFIAPVGVVAPKEKAPVKETGPTCHILVELQDPAALETVENILINKGGYNLKKSMN